MSWVTVFSMTASACLTLSLIHLFIWWRQNDAWANLLFALAALGTAAAAWFDLSLLRAESPTQMALVIRWSHLGHLEYQSHPIPRRNCFNPSMLS